MNKINAISPRTRLIVWGLGWGLALLGAGRASAITGREIMQKNEEARQVKESIAKVTLTAWKESDIGSSAGKKIKKFTWWRQLQEDQIHYFTLTRFHEPAEVRGEGILFLEKEGGENDVLMYLPAYKKIRRVESDSQSSSFMSSAFSYADISVQHLNDYQYVLLKEEKCPLEKSIQCYVVEAKPSSEATLERTGYTRSLHWVRSDQFMSEQVENFDKDGKLWKRYFGRNIQQVDPKNKKWMALDLHMEDLKGKRYTDLVFTDVKVDVKLLASQFTQTQLAKEN